MKPLLSRRTILAAGAVAAVDLLSSQPAWAAEPKHRVVVWSEKTAPKNVYPHDINGAVAEGLEPLKAKGWEVVTASINDPEQGCSAESLDKTMCSSGGDTNATARLPTRTSSGSSLA